MYVHVHVHMPMSMSMEAYDSKWMRCLSSWRIKGSGPDEWIHSPRKEGRTARNLQCGDRSNLWQVKYASLIIYQNHVIIERAIE
jgi:hypothetical protein